MQALYDFFLLSPTDRLVVMFVDVVIVVLFRILTYKFDWLVNFANRFKSIPVEFVIFLVMKCKAFPRFPLLNHEEKLSFHLFSFFSLVIVGCVCKPTGTDGNNLGCLILPFLRVYFV